MKIPNKPAHQTAYKVSMLMLRRVCGAWGFGWNGTKR